MSDLIQVRIGNPPWSPAPGTDVVDVIKEYDGPLLAILRQDGTEYMARCILGELATESVWAYVRLDVLEAAELRSDSMVQIDETAEYLTQGQLTIALVEDDQILYSTVVDAPGGSWWDRLRSMMEQVQESVSRVKDCADHFTQSLVNARRAR